MKRTISFLTCITFIACLFSIFAGTQVMAAQDKVINLKYALEEPPFPPSVKLNKEWAGAISKRTNGKVKITFYYTGTLAKGKDMRRSVARGLADIGVLTLNHDLTAYSLNSVVMLPILGIPNREAGTRIWMELLEKFPEMEQEFKGTIPLVRRIDLPHSLHSTKKPIRIPSDLENMKIASFGIGLKILDTMGASPIGLMPTEIYMGLERGVAEGAYATYFVSMLFRILDLIPYHNTTILNWWGMTTIMNARKWNSLPPDIRKIIEEESLKHGVNRNKLSKFQERKAREIVERKGQTFIENTPEETKQWHDSAKKFHEEWIAKNEAKGLPGRAVYEEAVRLVNKYNQ